MAFVDASAMIAGEPEADDLADRLERRQPRLRSALSIRETVAGLHRAYHFVSGAARATVASFVALNGLRVVVIGAAESDVALEAYAAFGKGRIRRRRRAVQITPSAASPATSAALMPSSDVSAHSVSSP